MSAKQLINGSTPYHDFNKVLIISDCHLGSMNCEAEILLDVLKEHNDFDAIVIAGDLFDSINIKLKPKHWKILQKLSKLNNVIWVKGNHDEPQPDLIASMLGITLCDSYKFVSGGNTFFVVHGDEFDEFISRRPLLTYWADLFYKFLQWADPTHKWALYAKKSSKLFLRSKDKIRHGAVQKYGKDAVVICGHTHFAESSIDYMNSGCFTELPCSFITIIDGEASLIYKEKS